MTLSRRRFLGVSAAGLAWSMSGCASPGGASLRLAVGADLHHDIMPDAPARLRALQEAADGFGADALAQLGDFCKPVPGNLGLLRQWRGGPGPQVDVLGNHDMDGGSTPERTAAWMGMPARHHSLVIAGHRLVVLDGNERRPDQPVAGYARGIGEAQLEWLERTLGVDDLPLVVLCHQGLDGQPGGIINDGQVRAVLERAHRGRRVRLVLTGHHHLDYLRVVAGIPYLQVNSLSYHWSRRPNAPAGRFPAEEEAGRPHLRNVMAYDRPLFALIELTPEGGRVVGREAAFLGGHGPSEAGMPPSVGGHPIVPRVSSRRL